MKLKMSDDLRAFLQGAVVLVTGGTGSFGNSVTERLIQLGCDQVRVFSRDEKKQDDMRHTYGDVANLKFFLGDVRDAQSLKGVMDGVDFIFHAAALKQVPSCEFFPIEAVKTNILGTENVLLSAKEYGVKKVVCLSTDKAVHPINAMGVSKAMMEKVAQAHARTDDQTIICTTRYGNVMASRGSVIPLFIDQIKNDLPLTVTDPLMTRFMMSLDEAVDLVLYSFSHGAAGDIFVQKSKAATVQMIAEATRLAMSRADHPIKIIGARHGEKLYETLLSRQEFVGASDCGTYFRVSPDTRDLNYARYTNTGDPMITSSLHQEDYSSHNAARMELDELVEKIQRIARV